MPDMLVVDDEEMIRRLIRKYAEFERFDVTEAADGMAAVLLCRKRKFDIIIMDIMMPELDGFSACREIRKESDTPILMLSARGEEYDKISGFELGIDDYVVKPFSPKELMLRVNAILKRVKKNDTEQNEIFTAEGLTADFLRRVWFMLTASVSIMSPKGIRFIFLYAAQPQHSAVAGKAYNRGLGIRFLRR